MNQTVVAIDISKPINILIKKGVSGFIRSVNKLKEIKKSQI